MSVGSYLGKAAQNLREEDERMGSMDGVEWMDVGLIAVIKAMSRDNVVGSNNKANNIVQIRHQ